MSEQELLQKAKDLYKKKKYADTTRIIMQIMEAGDFSKPVLLLSAKAWIGLTVTDTDDKTWSNLYNTISVLMDEVESLEEYLELRREILEAREDSKRDYLKAQLKKLEKKPNFDQFNKYNDASMMHCVFGLKISSTMSQHPKVKALLGGDAKKDDVTIGNELTKKEESLYCYDAGMRIADKAKEAFEADGGYSIQPRQTAEALLISRLLWKGATEELKKEPQEQHIQRLEKNQCVIQYMLKLCREYNVLTPSGQREWETELADTKQKISKAKKALEQKKKKEEEARIAAYWEARPEEKARLEEQLQKQEACYDELSRKVEAADKECDRECNKLKNILVQMLPSETEYEQQRSVVQDLEMQLRNCWFFQGKKKRLLRSQLEEDALPKLTELKKKSQAERKELKEKTNSRILELVEALRPQKNELAEVKKAVEDLRKELTMPR